MAELEDELDEIVPAKKTKQEPVKEKVKHTPAPSEDDEDEVAPKKAKQVMEDEDEVAPKRAKSSVQTLEIDLDDDAGLPSRGDGLPRVRPAKGEAKRFAFLPFMKVRFGKTHYIEGVGKRRCLTKADSPHLEYCCEKLGKEGALYLEALVIEYTNADHKTGRMEKNCPIEWQIAYLEMSRSNWESIKKLPSEDESLKGVDLIMTHDTSRAFGFAFNKISSHARWKANPALAKEVEEAASPFLDGEKLIKKLGKELSLIEWQALLSGKQGDSSESADLADLSDLD